MIQQNKSQSNVAALQAKIEEHELHIEVLAGNMFAQKQRADELEAALQEAEQERINQEQANEFVDCGSIERRQLLQDAATKPIRTFTQFDYFNQDTGVCGGPERDYDLFVNRTRELNRSGCVRLFIPDDYSVEDVRQALTKFTELVERGEVEKMQATQPQTLDVLFTDEGIPF